MTTVLFADDERMDRVAQVDYLRAKGLEVIEVVDPEQAMECLLEHPDHICLDLVVLDLVMPRDNENGGMQVLEYMREHEKNIPVILATAWGFDGPALRVQEASGGAVREVLTKPFLPKELHAAILKLLEDSSEKHPDDSPSAGTGT